MSASDAPGSHETPDASITRPDSSIVLHDAVPTSEPEGSLLEAKDSAATPEAAPAPTLDETSEPLQPRQETAGVDAPSSSPPSRPKVPSLATSPSSPLPNSANGGDQSSPRTPRSSSTRFIQLHPPPGLPSAPPHRRRPSQGSRRPSASALPPAAATPPPTLRHTAQDLRNLLRTFLVLVPSRLRCLRILIPPPLRRLASVIVNRLAMVLHKRGALACPLE